MYIIDKTQYNQSTAEIPFATAEHAKIAEQVIEVDAELNPQSVKRELSVRDDKLIVYVFVSNSVLVWPYCSQNISYTDCPVGSTHDERLSGKCGPYRSDDRPFRQRCWEFEVIILRVQN